MSTSLHPHASGSCCHNLQRNRNEQQPNKLQNFTFRKRSPGLYFLAPLFLLAVLYTALFTSAGQANQPVWAAPVAGTDASATARSANRMDEKPSTQNGPLPLDIPALRINFQTGSAETPAGYLADTGAVFGDRGNGHQYGWNFDNTSNACQRNAPNSPDAAYDTFNQTQISGDFTWVIALPNGRYRVRLVAGDPLYTNSYFHLAVEGQTALNGQPPAGQNWVGSSVDVTVSDGRLTLDNLPNAINNKINFMEIYPLESLPSFNVYLPEIIRR